MYCTCNIRTTLHSTSLFCTSRKLLAKFSVYKIFPCCGQSDERGRVFGCNSPDWKPFISLRELNISTCENVNDTTLNAIAHWLPSEIYHLDLHEDH